MRHNLHGETNQHEDEQKPIEQYDHKGKQGRVAVELADDRGIESLKILEIA